MGRGNVIGEFAEDGKLVSLLNDDVHVTPSGLGGAVSGDGNTLTARRNLFDPRAATPGFFMGVNGALTASALYGVSDFIPVAPGTTYYGGSMTLNNSRFSAYFDAARQPLNLGDAAGFTTTTAPAGAAFIRVTYYADEQDAYQFFEGNALSQFRSYGSELLPASVYDVVTGWRGKTWAHMGDSTSQTVPWTWRVAGHLGLTLSAYAVGGRMISSKTGAANAMCRQDQIDAISATNFNLVSILGGLNDWAQDTPLGAANSADETTFNGALNAWCSRALTRWPTKRLAIFGTTYGELIDLTGRGGWPNGWTNTLGLTTADYADACEAAARRYCIPYVDFKNNCGWSRTNITNFMKADGGLLHPASEGRDRMVAVAMGRLSEIAPVIG